jgi:hypothetical protein
MSRLLRGGGHYAGGWGGSLCGMRQRRQQTTGSSSSSSSPPPVTMQRRAIRPRHLGAHAHVFDIPGRVVAAAAAPPLTPPAAAAPPLTPPAAARVAVAAFSPRALVFDFSSNTAAVAADAESTDNEQGHEACSVTREATRESAYLLLELMRLSDGCGGVSSISHCIHSTSQTQQTHHKPRPLHLQHGRPAHPCASVLRKPPCSPPLHLEFNI